MAKFENGYEVKVRAFVPVDCRDQGKELEVLNRLAEIGKEVKQLLGPGSTFEAAFVNRRPKKQQTAGQP